MVETMRREGHKALVHTAAASNLGQMLNRICLEDGVGLVNIVRSEQQEQSCARRVRSTSATRARRPSCVTSPTPRRHRRHPRFDAIGGGALAGQILSCMEAAITRSAGEYQPLRLHDPQAGVHLRRCSTPVPTLLKRNFGVAWGVGGWLLMPFLQKIGPEAAQKLRMRVVAELKTTFASHYTREVRSPKRCSLGEIAVYGRRATGEKYLINPSRG